MIVAENVLPGEMSRMKPTRAAYPIHFAIAGTLGGTVEPFDPYQGPYVKARGKEIWLIIEYGSDFAWLYEKLADKRSTRFPAFNDDSPDMAASLVCDGRRWRKVKRPMMS